MALTIHAYQIPDVIVEGARGGPRFSKTVIMGATGVVYINENWQRPLWNYTVEFAEATPEIAPLIRDLFIVTKGGAEGVLFKDPFDYIATAQPIIGGILYRRYSFPLIGGGTATFDRKITRPVAGYTTGGGGTTWTGRFLIPVRIDTDALDVNVMLERMAGIPSLPLVEVLE